MIKLACSRTSNYFKLMYIKQYEPTSDHDSVLRTNSELDNLFEIRPFSEYGRYVGSEQKMECYATGHLKYVKLTEDSGAVLKSFVSLETNTITFFAVPMVFHNAHANTKFFPNSLYKISIPSANFLQKYFSKKSPDYQCIKHHIANNIEPLLYIRSSNFNLKSKDLDCFISMVMALSEFGQISTNSINRNFHPLFFQINPSTVTKRQYYLENMNPPSSVYVNFAQMQLVGLSGNNIQKTGLSIDFIDNQDGINHQIWATASAINTVDSTVMHGPLGFEYTDDTVNKIIVEDKIIFLEALNLLKRPEIRKIIYEPVLSKIINSELRTYPPEHGRGIHSIQRRNTKLRVIFNFAPIGNRNILAVETRPPYYPSSVPRDAINQSSVYGLFPNKLGNNIDPFNPPANPTKNRFTLYPLPEQTIRLKLPVKRNDEVLETPEDEQFASINQLIEYGYAALDDKLPFIVTLNSDRISNFFSGGTQGTEYVKRCRAIYNTAKTMAHELGHILYEIDNPLENYIWGLIETKYQWNGKPADYTQGIDRQKLDEIKALFDKFGAGHMPGGPSGIKACSIEKEFIECVKPGKAIFGLSGSVKNEPTNCDEVW